MNLEPIDTSTTAGKARVMQLAAEGRKVASRYAEDEDSWIEIDNPNWCWTDLRYAIIAEPVGPEELWASFSENGEIVSIYNSSPGAGFTHYRRANLAGRDE